MLAAHPWSKPTVTAARFRTMWEVPWPVTVAVAANIHTRTIGVSRKTVHSHLASPTPGAN
jgi:hypothetical protein